MAVKLQDAPSGQMVRGSVFLRNPSHVNELCSPKVDFSLSSDRDFILLNVPVQAYSLPVPPSAPPPVLLCLLGNIFVFSSPCSLPPLPALCSSVFQSVFSLLLSHPLPLPLFQIPQEQARVCRLHLLRRAPEVQLMVQSSWLRDSLSKQTDMQGVNLLFSSRRGHLFLQTDQPVYNPGQPGELAPGPPPFMPSQPLE